MRGQAFPERPVLGVWDAKVSTCLFHHLRDRRVVDVTDPREQVMFELSDRTSPVPEDQSRQLPGDLEGGGTDMSRLWRPIHRAQVALGRPDLSFPLVTAHGDANTMTES